ncbi:ATP-binding Cassette (ABC) Superfamily [Phytophthora nicotianae]|uniref:ATP-binding Cassette (ABC) Superfamily n=1 Tax=Phytophthora nicotianae TaxID=4792 RepID=A0A0W8DG44_PHYNI|nr:ATP-binding Cassette (ABC) Superfamily [Phytophthora nicotianae]
MVSVYVWFVIGAGALLVACVAFTFIKTYLDDRERRRREAEGGGPYSSSSDNENGESVDKGGVGSGATA